MKADKKEKKLERIKDEVAEFIGGHDMKNHHPLFDSEIVEYFSHYKKKHVVWAIEQVR